LQRQRSRPAAFASDRYPLATKTVGFFTSDLDERLVDRRALELEVVEVLGERQSIAMAA
jgi:hypothetical protein